MSEHHASPTLVPLTDAIHNISMRNLTELCTGSHIEDDRQFLKTWRRHLHDCLNQQNARVIQFPAADVSGEVDMVTKRCTDILHRYSRPTWSLSSSAKDVVLSVGTGDAVAWVTSELGITPEALREHIRRVIKVYTASTVALCAAEGRLEDKLKQLETLVGRVNDLMFLEPTAELSALAGPAKTYLDSVFEKIGIESEYRDLIERYKQFSILKGLVNLSTFQKQGVPTCTICMNKGVTHATIPCGHTYCEECSTKQTTLCYMCRVQIRDRVRLFFS
jgi:hypothetical protein